MFFCLGSEDGRFVNVLDTQDMVIDSITLEEYNEDKKLVEIQELHSNPLVRSDIGNLKMGVCRVLAVRIERIFYIFKQGVGLVDKVSIPKPNGFESDYLWANYCILNDVYICSAVMIDKHYYREDREEIFCWRIGVDKNGRVIRKDKNWRKV